MSDERLKLWFGFTLTFLLIVLAGSMALGKVYEASSYGLHDVLVAIAFLSGSWSQWAFGSKKEPEKKQE